MKYLNLLFLFILTISASCAQQNPAPSAAKLLPPVQEINEPELKQFLTELEAAVEQKDKAFIIDHLSPSVKNNFGGDGGIEEFKSQWNWSEDAASFWAVMNRIIEMGGGEYKGDGNYFMPYVYTHWPDQYDAFQHVAITAENVEVRSQPDSKEGEVLGTLDYEIVREHYEKSLEPSLIGGRVWHSISTLDGRMEGYVSGEKVWSPVGYRIGFVKAEGKWLISFLVAGD